MRPNPTLKKFHLNLAVCDCVSNFYLLNITCFESFFIENIGKSPLVVMDDFDLDEAVEIAHNAVFASR